MREGLGEGAFNVQYLGYSVGASGRLGVLEGKEVKCHLVLGIVVIEGTLHLLNA